MALKYIKFKHRGFVLFEETQSHADMARAIGGEVESAGRVHAVDWCDDGKPVCSGESSTLNLRSADADTDTLRRRLAL